MRYGTGSLYRRPCRDGGAPALVRAEETTWRARPDWSRDGKRIVYASYLGRQWHQLWITTAAGGDPFPLTYGDYDATAPRWSPDGMRIAYIANESGNTEIRIMDVPGGAQRRLDDTVSATTCTRAARSSWIVTTRAATAVPRARGHRRRRPAQLRA